MDIPKLASISNAGSAFECRFEGEDPGTFVLWRANSDERVELATTPSASGGFSCNVDFYGPDLYAITSGTWRIVFKDDDGQLVAPEIPSKLREQYKLAGYRFDLRANPNGNLYVKVSKRYGRLENTHAKRERNAKHAYALFRALPLDKNKVFFESLSTRVFNDNPRAIYEELRSRDADYTMVWALQNEKTPIGKPGIAVRYYTLSYWYHLATAKYVVSNMNQLQAVKRPGQVFVQTMHGTPLKKMGLSVTKAQWKIERMKQLFQHDWDYFVTPSDFFSEVLRGPSYGFAGQFIEAGYPRNDVLVNNRENAQLIASVRKQLGVPDGKKVILYAPTWRTKKRFDLKIDLAAMKEKLGGQYVLVLRSHYLEQEFVPQDIYDDFVIDGHGYSNANDMLIAADVLVTDYSSIMFDYAIMQRPLILFTWDYNNYVNKKRGTYFDLKEEYPELIAMNGKQLLEKFDHLDQVMDAVERFHKRFNQYETGHAAADVVDTLFGASC